MQYKRGVLGADSWGPPILVLVLYPIYIFDVHKELNTQRPAIHTNITMMDSWDPHYAQYTQKNEINITQKRVIILGYFFDIIQRLYP